MLFPHLDIAFYLSLKYDLPLAIALPIVVEALLRLEVVINE